MTHNESNTHRTRQHPSPPEEAMPGYAEEPVVAQGASDFAFINKITLNTKDAAPDTVTKKVHSI